MNQLIPLLQSMLFESVGDTFITYLLQLLISMQKRNLPSIALTHRSFSIILFGTIVQKYIHP